MRFFSCVLVLLTAVLLGGVFFSCMTKTVWADDSYVRDSGNLFSDDEERKIEEICEKYREENGMNVFVLTVNNSDVGGSDDYDTQKYIEDYSDAVYQGQDAIGLIINMDIRYFYMDIRGDNALAVYTDSRQDVLYGKISSQLKQVNYYKAVEEMVSLADKYAKEGPGEASGTEDFGVTHTELLASIAIAVIVSSIILAVMISAHHEKKMAVGAQDYIPKGGFQLSGQRDVFVRQYVTKTSKETRSSGGGTTTHRSSSGSSHSGRGGHF